jgi:hypothetical protein
MSGVRVCSRPAVSTIRTSTPRASAAFTASNATAPGSAPRSWETSDAPVRSAQTPSCSPAAARNVSLAAMPTERPCAWSRAAIFPIVVVLPVPLTPTTITIPGRPSGPDGASQGVSSANVAATS